MLPILVAREEAAATFSLERYRTQWGHLPLVRLTWRDVGERVARPSYSMGAAEWETFVEMVCMSDRSTFVTDARVR